MPFQNISYAQTALKFRLISAFDLSRFLRSKFVSHQAKVLLVYTWLIQFSKSYISFRGKPGADCVWDLQCKRERRALLNSGILTV